MTTLTEALEKIEPKEIKEYLDLFHRHYQLNELWPDDVEKCPPLASRLFDLEATFRGVDIKATLLSDLEKVLAVARELARMIEHIKIGELNFGPNLAIDESGDDIITCMDINDFKQYACLIEQDCIKILEGDK